MVVESMAVVPQEPSEHLAITEGGIAQASKQLALLQQFVRQVMVKGVDYGEIPGVDRPTLLKPGAEKLLEVYGYVPRIKDIRRVEDWERPFFQYEVTVQLVSKRTGEIVGEGVGSCNSLEAKYAYRWVWPDQVPTGLDKQQLIKREFTGRDGSRKYTKYRIENEDIYSQVNTLLKMAKKRALIDATLSVTRSSGIFTQDVEDLVDTDAAEEEDGPGSPDGNTRAPTGRLPGRATEPKQPGATYTCTECGKPIAAVQIGKKTYSPEQVGKATIAKYGWQLCYSCGQKEEAARKGQQHERALAGEPETTEVESEQPAL